MTGDNALKARARELLAAEYGVCDRYVFQLKAGKCRPSQPESPE